MSRVFQQWFIFFFMCLEIYICTFVSPDRSQHHPGPRDHGRDEFEPEDIHERYIDITTSI